MIFVSKMIDNDTINVMIALLVEKAIKINRPNI